MASSNPAFDPAFFRQKIRETMTMGLPNATADRATFRWTTQKTFAQRDSAGHPWDYTSTPVSTTTHVGVRIPVAWEFQTQRISSTANVVGEFDNSRVLITILDEDYDQVIGADLVLLGQDIYEIEFVAPPIGLFEVTVYQVYARARDES